jgi:hypothetical protein
MLYYKIQNGITQVFHYSSGIIFLNKKIIFFLVIVSFVPITVVVFSPKSHSISNFADAAYINLYNQANSGFVIQKPNGINCSN